MRDAFTPVFLLSLAVLFLAHGFASSPFILRPLALAAFGLFLALFALKRYRPAYAAAALALALLLGAAYLERSVRLAADGDLPFPAGEYVTVSGRLQSFPEIEPERTLLRLRADSFAWGQRRLRRSLQIRLAIGGDCRNLNRGDRVEVDARIDAPQVNRNFYPNPYEAVLRTQGIQATAFCKSPQLVRLVSRAGPLWRLVGAWRERVRRAIEGRYLRDGALQPPGVFLEATLLGDRGRLENGEQEALIGSGVFHLLAISGGNIAMLALVSLLVCRGLGFPLRLRYGLTSLLLLLYLALSGFDVSAARATLMALLLFAGRVWFMDAVPSNILSFCGLLLLAANPAQFLDPGFILTFALTAAILAGRRIFLPFLKPLPRWLAEAISANVSAGVMALPLSLFYFQRYAFSGLLSGLLLAPLAAGVTVCGALLLPLAWLPPAAASLALAPAGVLLDAFFAASGWIAAHFSLSVFRPSPPPWLVAVTGLLFFFTSWERLRARPRAAAALLLVAALSYVSLPPAPYDPGRLEAYFLDVGHGDAVVVVFPGGDALLVDGGGANFSDFQVGRRLVLPFLLQKRIRVRWAAATHFHPDHARGLAEVVGVLAPEELWLASNAAASEWHRQLLSALPRRTRVRWVQRGFSRRSGGCTVSCLYPARLILARRSENEHSMVLRVEDGRHSFLLCGDIEDSVEPEIARALGPALASDVIKIAHHGSRASSTPRFLDLVRPRLAVISHAAGNHWGFPHREVVGRLQRRGVRWLSTARRGGIRIASRPGCFEIEVSK